MLDDFGKSIMTGAVIGCLVGLGFVVGFLSGVGL